jgi:hypothetical protein
MTTATAEFISHLNNHLDQIETCLIGQDAMALETACQKLHLLLSGSVRSSQAASKAPHTPALSANDAAKLHAADKRLQGIRQALAQRASANDRSLVTLIPDYSVAAYGQKSAFGGAPRGPNLKSFQV